MIARFQGAFGYLSNFWICRHKIVDIDYPDIEYPAVEHAYQAAKSLDAGVRKRISQMPTPSKAKRFGQKIELRPDWENVKENYMRLYVRQKFQNNARLKRKLIETGDQQLIEGNTWGDMYWGICYGRGENKLGKILMQTRTELQALEARIQ